MSEEQDSLDSILTEYKSIKDAPDTVEDMFNSHRIGFDKSRIEYVFGLERKLKYKSLRRIKNDFEVCLIQNPFSWKLIEKNGVSIKIRRIPETVGKLSDLLHSNSINRGNKKTKDKYKMYQE